MKTSQDPVASGSLVDQIKDDHSDKFARGSAVNQNVDKMERKAFAVEGQMKSNIQRMEVKLENAVQKATEAQKSNKELQANYADVQNQLSRTQQQLSHIHKSNEHLQNQISAILNKLTHTEKWLFDMQRSNEQLRETNACLQNQLSLTQQQFLHVCKSNEALQTSNADLKNQLSLTQQQFSHVRKSNEALQTSNADLKNQLSLTQKQLLGVQSMMTCSRLWVISHNQFTIGREIGRGSWASVHEATFRGDTVAAKRLYDIITSPDNIQLFHREMQMALHCQHHNIVTFFGATVEGHPVILMELMDCSLRDAYTKGRGTVKDHQVLGILRDVANALHFLHTRPDPVIHRDVSSANVLLKTVYNGELLAKLGDFGTAKMQKLISTPGPGALAYAAPEFANPRSHSAKMDVYSFGVLMIEVLTKTLPLQALDDLKAQIQKEFPRYHHLVTSCTIQQPSHRPTMYDIIKQLDKN